MEFKLKDANELTELTGDISTKRLHIDIDTLMTTTTGEYFKTVNLDAEMLEDQIALIIGYGDGILATLTLNTTGIHFETE